MSEELQTASENLETQFSEVLTRIRQARKKAFQQVNSALIELYWNLGKYISDQVSKNAWGKGIVVELAKYIESQEPNLRGFTTRNLWRMKQFFEIYKDTPKLSPLVSQISWTNNLLIMASSKSDEEREFYLIISIKERYSKRELERQLDSGLFERTILADKKLSNNIERIPAKHKKCI